ncbi:diguanylate cyclase [Arcobacter sp. LA11]|uniref:GGDEF domain-containing response regulator n=1 Tax=Arcobacter sp. LA11 TaxID=1898176 RepID=UPI000932A140|nr:diguanylate cyclase [Arcobacter sp. LA11]
MNKILIVDDSTTTLSILTENLLDKLDNIEILSAKNYKEGLKYIVEYGNKIAIAVVDLHLPDSKYGAMLEVTDSKFIKTIVLSGTLNDKVKKIIFEKEYVIDCIAKDGKKSIKSVVNSVNREIKNRNKNILLVDDSSVQISIAQKLLKKMNLNVTMAANGKEALQIIKNSEKTFSLVLTDYHMPIMDGMELTFRLREIYDKDELGIIALSSNTTLEIATEFLKIGANDFINKPYLETEVVTRINANLDLIDLFNKTKDMANKDFLTGLYNRRYFFESGNIILKKSIRAEKNLALAMLDIDNFKNINDTYGHEVGDTAICEVGSLIHKYLRSIDLIARFGGEEFCILIEDIKLIDVENLFEKIRLAFEKNIIKANDSKLIYTVSIGVFYGIDKSLEKMLKIADDALYYCKNNGRNQVKIKDLTKN